MVGRTIPNSPSLLQADEPWLNLDAVGLLSQQRCRRIKYIYKYRK
jgi:ABC-type ATPase involved in cell division